jgi:hypothetical protein
MDIYENYLQLNVLFHIQTKHSVKQQLNGLSQQIRYEFLSKHHMLSNSIQYKPIQALEHPTFHKMINIAARATNGVTIPNRKVTRDGIMDMFKAQMTHLKTRLSVRIFAISTSSTKTMIQSDAVTGEISLTCDVWQASNTDGYFAVIGHWIEESRPGLVYGKSRAHCLVSRDSTMLIMGSGLVALCSRLLTDLVLLIEYVK